jgi:hypothetical protein
LTRPFAVNVSRPAGGDARKKIDDGRNESSVPNPLHYAAEKALSRFGKAPVSPVLNTELTRGGDSRYPLTHLLQLATPSSRNLLIPHEAMPSTQKS